MAHGSNIQNKEIVYSKEIYCQCNFLLVCLLSASLQYVCLFAPTIVVPLQISEEKTYVHASVSLIQAERLQHTKRLHWHGSTERVRACNIYMIVHFQIMATFLIS